MGLGIISLLVGALAAPSPAAAQARVAVQATPAPLVWLRDADTRAAAVRLAELLRAPGIDALTDADALAAQVEAAAKGGTAADDALIGQAWVRYVKALRAPVGGVTYGDPKLALKMPSDEAIRAAAASAPSLLAHVNQVAAVNPFYAALRDTAVKQGAGGDSHVRATLDRLRLLPGTGRALLVDVANAQLLLIEDGGVADSMKVVVGKPDFPTPLLAGTIHYVTLNPYWHIPQDVARRKVAPIVLKRGVGYLKAARYQTVAAFGGEAEQPIDPESIDWKAVADGSVEANIRQLAGPQNMMGKMKFGFVNDLGIYLHDTPHKELFAKAKRNLSLGCVRVERPQALATWLLGREPDPPSDDYEKLVQLDRGVPIYILALTARPDGDSIAYAEDVYGLDPAMPAATASATAEASAR